MQEEKYEVTEVGKSLDRTLRSSKLVSQGSLPPKKIARIKLLSLKEEKGQFENLIIFS